MSFELVIPAIAKCEGYVVNLISMSVIEEVDALEIGFRWGPGKSDITLSLRRIYYFALGKTAVESTHYVDRITATPLSTDRPWPAGVPVGMYRTPGLPDLLWIRTEPLHLEVVAATVTVLEEAGVEPWHG